MQSIKIKILIQFWAVYLSKPLEYGCILHLQQTSVLTSQCQVLTQQLHVAGGHSIGAQRLSVRRGWGRSSEWRRELPGGPWLRHVGVRESFVREAAFEIEIGRILLIMLLKTIILIIFNTFLSSLLACCHMPVTVLSARGRQREHQRQQRRRPGESTAPL